MSFLAPFFLLGALALGLPVIFHLIRRTTRQRTVFSSLMFLLPSPPRLTRRSRVEHILLLVLRCAALCLLALGFARPFLQRPPPPPSSSAGRRLVLLVDTSASMRRANLWTDARAKVASLVRQTSPADQVAVFTFDRQLKPVITREEWKATPAGSRPALVAQRLAAISPGWAGTHLGNALIESAEMLAEKEQKTAGGRGQIVLISDLQQGSRLEVLQGYEWPRDVEVLVERLKSRSGNNASLQLITEADGGEASQNDGLRVRVNNAPDSRREQFRVGWAQPDGRAFLAKPVEVYVPPGQGRIVTIPVAASTAGSDRLLLQGDDEDFDNTLFLVPPQARRLNVLYLGSDSAQDAKTPLYFLERAFQTTRRETVAVLARRPDAPVSIEELRAASLIVITEPLPDALVGILHEQAVAGKTLVFAPKSEAAASTLACLIQVERLTLSEVHPESYALLAEIDFRHPLFSPFADPRFSDFTKIHFWKYRRVDAAAIPGAHAIAKFEDGDPALLDVPIGKGRVFVMACAWSPEDCQLALSTKFVPLLYSLLEQGGGAVPILRQYHVGDIVGLPAAAVLNQSGLAVALPDGSKAPLQEGQTNFSQTIMPGIYSVTAPPAGTVSAFAVNLDPSESRTTPLGADELERFGVPMSSPAPAPTANAQRQIRLQNLELENRQKLWRWFIVGTLAILLIESWLAGRAARRVRVQAEAVT